MRVTHLNLPKDHIGLTKLQGLQLKIGDLLPALVLKTGPEHALLLIKGKQILAEVKTLLQPGEELKVRVTGEFQNKVILKVLTGTGTANPSPVDQLLRQVGGGRPDAETRSALAYLLRNGLPVTSDTLRAAIRDQQKPLDQILSKLFAETVHSEASGDSAGQNPETPAADSSPRPAQSGKSDGIQTPLQHGEQIGSDPQDPRRTAPQNRNPEEQITDPAIDRENLPAARSASGEGTEKPATAAPFAVRTNQASVRPQSEGAPLQREAIPVSKENFSPDGANSGDPGPDPEVRTAGGQTGTETITRLISETLREAANPGTGLKNDARMREGNPTGKPAGPAADGEAGTRPHTARLRQPQTVQTNQAAPSYSAPTSTGERLVQLGLALNPERSVAALAAGLKELARHLGLAPAKEGESAAAERQNLAAHLPNPLGEEQKEGLHELAEKMLGLRLHQQEESLLLHMEIPLYFRGQLATAHLQIREDEHRQGEAGEKPLSILFNLRTDFLGHLKVMALLGKEAISCQFASDRETTRMLLRQTLPKLRERFEAISYQVNHMGVFPLMEEEPSAVKIEPLPGQVDFRV